MALSMPVSQNRDNMPILWTVPSTEIRSLSKDLKNILVGQMCEKGDDGIKELAEKLLLQPKCRHLETNLADKFLEFLEDSGVTLDKLLTVTTELEWLNVVEVIETYNARLPCNLIKRVIVVARELAQFIPNPNSKDVAGCVLTGTEADINMLCAVQRVLGQAGKKPFTPLVLQYRWSLMKFLFLFEYKVRLVKIGEKTVVKNFILRSINQGVPIIILYTKAVEASLAASVPKFGRGLNHRWILEELLQAPNHKNVYLIAQIGTSVPDSLTVRCARIVHFE